MNRRTYLLLSFIEGACVMAAELIGAKMLAPFFGSSLYVWATVLAITLGGLALGYFAGGEMAHRSKNPLLIFYVLLTAGIFLLLMPFTSKFLLHYLQYYELIKALLISGIIFLMPPVFLMGMVSPLLIQALSDEMHSSGRMAGLVYAVSTCGGICATFLLGFYIIPEFGLTKPSIAFGLLLALIPAIVLLRKRKFFPVLFLFFSLGWMLKPETKSNSNIKVLYQSEGLLGQLMVVDYPNYHNDSIQSYSRILYCNRIIQSMINEDEKEKFRLPYIEKIMQDSLSVRPGNKVLLLGLGGGVLAGELQSKSCQVDAIEFDGRMQEIATNYFQLSSEVNVIIDDARHYLNGCNKKYDLIIFDLFKAEENPNHVLTAESLERAKQILNPDGWIILNGNGYIKGESGMGMRSIYKTFLHEGFQVRVDSTGANEAYRNALFFASQQASTPIASVIDTTNAWVLTDEYPVLDLLNKDANRAWRMGYIQTYIRTFDQQQIPLFN